jgi:phage shock protein A
MALLERVRTLIRANLNDLIDKAEDPEKMLKQLILDMENQLMQVKTQVAVSIADQHMLEKKRQESAEKAAEWMHKAELAVDKKQDDLARAALERHQGYVQMAESFQEQVADQKVQVENLKTALNKLEQKLTEARAKGDLLIAQQRRSRASLRASQARMSMGDTSKAAAFDRLQDRVLQSEAVSEAHAELAEDSLEERLQSLDREDRINQLLADLKARRGIRADA